MIKGYIHSKYFYEFKDVLFFLLINVFMIFITIKTLILGFPILIFAISNFNANILIPHFAKGFELYVIENGFATVCETYISDKKDITKVEYTISTELQPRKYYIIDICEKIAKIYNISMGILSIVLFVISFINLFF